MVHRIKDFLLGSSVFIAIIVVWQFCYSFGIIPSWLIPTPTETANSFLRLASDGTLTNLVLISLSNVFPAFVAAVAASLVVGFAIGSISVVRKIFMPFLSAMYVVPSLAWLPLIILFLGFSRETIWLLIFISTFTRMIYSIINGVRSVNPIWLLAGKNLGLSKWEITHKIMLPASLPHVLSGLRIGFGSAWRSLIGAEMLVVTAGGLGKYIWMSQWSYRFDQVFAGVFVIAVIGIICEELIFKRIEQRTLIRWGMIT